MGSYTRVATDNALAIDRIHPHFSRSMNDLMVVKQNAHMRDAAIWFIKKCEVT